MKVTRVAYSHRLNVGKYAVLAELNTTVAPIGTPRLVLRNNRVEIHYQIDAADMRTSQKPAGLREIGVDKGYPEVFTDSDGQHHGTDLGRLLSPESDSHKRKGRARAKLRSIANTAAQRGDQAKANRIRKNNLGTVKRDRWAARWQTRVRTQTFTAVHRVVDKAKTIVAEDLTRTFAGRKPLGKKHPATLRRSRHRLAHPTHAGEADLARTDRLPPDQTAGPGLQSPPGGGERNIHQ